MEKTKTQNQNVQFSNNSLVTNFYCFWHTGILFSGTWTWSVMMPGSMKGLYDSCLVIPCSYSYDSDPPTNPYRVVWYQYVSRGCPLVFDSWYPGSVIDKFRWKTNLYRTSYTRDCSLLIQDINLSHHGEKLYTWIDPENVGSSTYRFYDVTSTIYIESKYLIFSLCFS